MPRRRLCTGPRVIRGGDGPLTVGECTGCAQQTVVRCAQSAIDVHFQVVHTVCTVHSAHMNKRTASKSAAPRVCIYVRVSTAEQVRSGLSLDSQVEKARAYCAFKGFTVVEVVEDAGVSGGIALARRPGGARVRELVEVGAVDAVIACKLDRLFRDAADCLAETKAWDAGGIALHLLDMGIDTSSAVGRAFLTVAAGFAELEKNLIGERTSAALQAKKARGEALGVAGGRNKIGATDAEREIVAAVVKARAAGLSIREIAAELAAAGMRTRRGGEIQSTQVARILRAAA